MQSPHYPEVPDDFGHWLAGFIDGEGYFVIEKRGSGYGFAPRFGITVRDDDDAILTEIAERTGIGKLRHHRRSVQRSRPGAKPQAVWEVRTKGDSARLIALLDVYPLRAKKARDYATWREATLIWIGMPRPRGRGYGGGLFANDWSRIARAREQHNAGRAYEPLDLPPAPEPPPALWED